MSEILEAYLRHERALKKYLFRFFPRGQDVDDVAQEAFIKAFATEIRTEVRHPKRLLFRAAKHAALSELAKKANTTTDSIEDFNDTAVLVDGRDVGAEKILDGKRKLAAFSMAVADLPPVCRQVFLLRKFEGLSAKEVAGRMKISVSAVEKHVAAGILKCSRRLRELGYDPAEFGPAEFRTGAAERRERESRRASDRDAEET